jgi:hypothetical protein
VASSTLRTPRIGQDGIFDYSPYAPAADVPAILHCL